MNLERMVANLAQQVQGRYFGKYRGLVIENSDPEHLGRLKVQVPSVLGEEIVTGWALPCVPYGGAENQGFLFIPDVGAGVWVEFEEGDLEFPIWVGTYWSKPGGQAEIPYPNEPDGTEADSKNDPPTRKIIKTAKGHTIQLEDNDGEEMVTIVEATNSNVITLNRDGIMLTDTSGNSIQMKKDGFILLATQDFTLDASGKAVVIKANTIDMQQA